VIHSYPWTGQYQPSSLFHLRAEDVTQSVALHQSDAAELDPSKDSLVSTALLGSKQFGVLTGLIDCFVTYLLQPVSVAGSQH